MGVRASACCPKSASAAGGPQGAAKDSFTEFKAKSFCMNSFPRRTSDADRKMDLRWFAGRPCGSSDAGEEFRWPEDGRQKGFGFLPSLSEGPRWIMDAIALRRDERQAEGHHTGTTYPVGRTGTGPPATSFPPHHGAWTLYLN